jgi:hypothetical protein
MDQSASETNDLVVMASPSPMYDEKTGKRLIYGAQQSNVIYDARPQTNAEVNRMNKGGSENMTRYNFASKIFLNIPNIHGVRKSLHRISSALQDTDILSTSISTQALDSSSWLEYISCILRGSASIAKKVGIEHSHVLVHCSDGWDRTSQLCALAQIMLDPYFRTIDGFIVLVEKDFLSFGHMFRLRAGHLNHESWFTVDKDVSISQREPQPPPQEGQAQGDVLQNAIGSISSWWAKRLEEKGGGDSEGVLAEDAVPQEHKEHIGNQEATSLKNVSPVFHQFLDCVRQMQRQFPTRFEFNERFLRRLYYHSHSCQYGTFLYNSEMQRRDARVQERTVSVWSYFLSRRAEFTNPSYDAVIDDRNRDRTRLILVNDKDVRWWHQLFNRSDAEMNAHLDAAAAAQSHLASTMAAFGAEPQSGSKTPAFHSSPKLDPASMPASEPMPTATVDDGQGEDGMEDLSAHLGLSDGGFDGGVDGANDARDPKGSPTPGTDVAPVSGIAATGLGPIFQSLSQDVMRIVTGGQQPSPAPRPDQELREMT